MTIEGLRSFNQETNNDCGPAALATLSSLVYVAWLGKLAGTTNHFGTFPEGLMMAAKGIGFKITSKEGMTLDDLRQTIDKGLPVLIGVQMHKGGHYIVMCGYGLGTFQYLDPGEEGPQTIGYEEIDKIWFDWDDGKIWDHWGMTIQVGD